MVTIKAFVLMVILLTVGNDSDDDSEAVTI